MVKILMDNLATNKQHISTTNLLLPCLSKVCILEDLIYLKNINIGTSNSITALQRLYILVYLLLLK
jgi:hypothetical protein